MRAVPARMQGGAMKTNGKHCLSASTVLTVSVPVAVWGLIGQQDATGTPPEDLDHAVRPWDLPTGLAPLLGGCAVLLAAASGGFLLRATRTGRLDRRWWQVLTPLLVSGAVLGAGWRVLTAGVVGANIGAGFVLLLGGPLVAGLLLWAAARGGSLAWRQRTQRSPGRRH